MPLPIAPATLKANALAAIPVSQGSDLRVRANGNGSALFPTDGSVINLPGVYDNTQNNAAQSHRAIFVIEAAAGSVAAVPVRFWQDGTYPTTGAGLPAYDGGPVEINGIQNLMNCRLISTDGLAHTINVQFFQDLA